MSKEKRRNIISSAFCGALASYILYLTLTTFVKEKATGGGPFANSAFYPQLVAGVIILLSILLFLSSLIKKGKGKLLEAEKDEPADAREQFAEDQPLEQDKPPRGTSVAIALILILYTVSLDLFGYIIVTPFFMALLFGMLAVRHWITIVFLSVISTYSLYVFFASLLGVILPPGRYSFIWW